MASKALGDDKLVEAVLSDWRTAPIDDKLRATLGFLEKLTLSPADIGPDDVEPVRNTGVSDAAIEDAIHVAAMFNIIDRVADALDFEIPSPESFARGANTLLKRGYG